jgi:hypothetical protein
MKVYTRVVIDMKTMKTVESDSYAYDGPVALCWGSGDSPGVSGRGGDTSDGHGIGSDSGGGGNDSGNDSGGWGTTDRRNNDGYGDQGSFGTIGTGTGGLTDGDRGDLGLSPTTFAGKVTSAIKKGLKALADLAIAANPVGALAQSLSFLTTNQSVVSNVQDLMDKYNLSVADALSTALDSVPDLSDEAKKSIRAEIDNSKDAQGDLTQGTLGQAFIDSGYYAADTTDAATGTDSPGTTYAAKNAKDVAVQQWQRYLDTFAPLENKMVAEASAPVEEQPGFARMMATIDRGYADNAANVRRTLAGRYPSGAGMEPQAQYTNEMNRTRAKTGAVADMDTARFDKMVSAANIGRGLPGEALAGFDSAEQIKQYNQSRDDAQSQSTWDAIGAGVGNLAQMYTMSKLTGGDGGTFSLW